MAHKVSIQSLEKSAAFFPRVLEIFSDHDHLYLHTEYLSGRSLGIPSTVLFTKGACRTVFELFFYAAPAQVVEYLAPPPVAHTAPVATATVGFGSLPVEPIVFG